MALFFSELVYSLHCKMILAELPKIEKKKKIQKLHMHINTSILLMMIINSFLTLTLLSPTKFNKGK